jgi:replicative DNA helicase
MQAARLIHNDASKIRIDETPGITLSEIRSRCKRLKKEGALDIIIIDYLQLMSGSEIARKQGREREISEISIGLKGLAKELKVPVIAAAQLNRGPDSRPDKRPKISDLRESGSMEQDADQILFIYRDDYYNPNSELAGKAEIIIAKNRHGETASIHLAWLPNYVSFHNLIKD